MKRDKGWRGRWSRSRWTVARLLAGAAVAAVWTAGCAQAAAPASATVAPVQLAPAAVPAPQAVLAPIAKRRPSRIQLDDEQEGDDDDDFGVVEDQTSHFRLRGKGWKSRLDRDADVSSGESYDRLKLFDEKASFECAVATGSATWLLPLLSALLSEQYVNAAYLHQSIVWARDAQPPIFLWQLGTSNNEILALADVTLVVARVELGHAAACVYKGHYEAAPFVAAARRLLSDLQWEGDSAPDGAQTSIVKREPVTRVRPFVHILGPSGERGRYPADETFAGIIVGGLLVRRTDYSATERVSERGWDLALGSRLRSLREHELVREGDASDVLVRARYRSATGGNVVEAVLTREAVARYQLKRGNGAPERFVTDHELAGPFLARARLRQAYDGPQGFKVSVPEFVPEVSLGRASVVTYKRDAGHDRSHMTREVGQQRDRCHFTSWGQITTIGDNPKNGSRQIVDVAGSGTNLPGRHHRLPRPPTPVGVPRNSL